MQSKFQKIAVSLVTFNVLFAYELLCPNRGYANDIPSAKIICHLQPDSEENGAVNFEIFGQTPNFTANISITKSITFSEPSFIDLSGKLAVPGPMQFMYQVNSAGEFELPSINLPGWTRVERTVTLGTLGLSSVSVEFDTIFKKNAILQLEIDGNKKYSRIIFQISKKAGASVGHLREISIPKWEEAEMRHETPGFGDGKCDFQFEEDPFL